MDYVETGKYISAEFRLGQVYDGEPGAADEAEDVILYRPVYVRVADKNKVDKFLDSRLSDSPPSLAQRNGSQKSGCSAAAAEPAPPLARNMNLNGDLSPRAPLEDSSNEAIQLF